MTPEKKRQLKKVVAILGMIGALIDLRIAVDNLIGGTADE